MVIVVGMLLYIKIMPINLIKIAIKIMGLPLTIGRLLPLCHARAMRGQLTSMMAMTLGPISLMAS